MELDIKVEGLAVVLANLKRFQRLITLDINKALTDVGFVVQREARRNAKKDRGDLERDIDFKVGRDNVEIFVGLNTPSGKYAKIQHDKVQGRGRLTRAKGARAGWKFIARAIEKNERKIEELLAQAFDSIPG